MLGYRPDEFPGRAVFEALGRGQEVSADHVFAYAALRPAERRDDGWWLTGRPDPERDAEEAEALVARCDGITIDGLTFSLTHVWRGEAVLRISGGADERVTDTDSFFRAWYPVLRPQPLVPEAERTARACEEWTREVMRRLEGERFNVITLKWFGRPREVPSFLQRHGIDGDLRSRVGVPARPGTQRRPRARGEPAHRRRARPRAARCGRHVRLRPRQARRRGRAHEGSEREARGGRAARRGIREPPDRPRDRVRHRRPRDAGVARRHPFRRPGAVRRGRPGRPRRPRAASSASRRAPKESSATCAVRT